MKIHIYWIVTIILFASACSNSNQQDQEGKVYQVDLDEKVNPFEKIFSHAEIISLETVSDGLMVWPERIFPFKDLLYVYDFWGVQKLFVFDAKGKFVKRIGRRGQGPDEYLNMYDCLVDTLHGDIYFMNVSGQTKQYDLNGNFKKDVMFPDRPHYYSMSLVGDSLIATWSCMKKEDDCVLLLNKFTEDTINSFWNDDDIFNHRKQFPFHRYEDKSYFSVSLRHEVYEITPDRLVPAYVWDFGEDNISPELLEYYLDFDDPNERNRRILDDIGTNILPFCFGNQYVNSAYHYVSVIREGRSARPMITHVFYDKEHHEGLVFDYLDEKECRMNSPLYFGNDYLLTDIHYDNRETFQSILPKEEYQKLENMLEDDNPRLLKLYFKN